MRRFYALPEQFENEKVTLNADETRHLRDVLRLREGEKVQVFDGAGREFLCSIEKITKKDAFLTILEEISSPAAESNLDLTLAVALLKGEKFDFVVQKSVELGVSKFVPLLTKRCDVKIKDAKEAEKKLERWKRIALEAAKQTGRAKLMQVEAPKEFKEFIESGETAAKILFSERGGESFSAVKASEKIVAVTGAEGGWEDAEIEAARRNGFQIVTFGGRILRAETASLAVAALLQNHFGDLN
jgi:16S rRNA (uracil1498-N3)-methyltransferase